MNEYLTTTTSVCASCRRLIPAQVFARADGVWLHKVCPQHGLEEVRVHGDAAAYQQLNQYHRRATLPLSFATTFEGCPDSCGLCPEHEQHVCLPIIEITDHCNLECPICLVTTPGRYHRTAEEVARMLDGLIRSEGQIDVLNLSGGEPTLNPHFREIIEACVARKEIVRVSVSTNGLVLARNEALLDFLGEKQVVIALQFDGLDDGIYRALRGRPLLEEKLRLIERCAQKDIAMSLTATVVQGINDHKLAEIANVLFQQGHILSLMLQPAAYAGQAARLGRPERGTTIPDVVRGLAGAGSGAVSPGDFTPLPCSHPACFALAFYLKVEGERFVPIKQLVSGERYLSLIQNRAIFGTDAESFAQVTDAVYDMWSGAPGAEPPQGVTALAAEPPPRFAALRTGAGLGDECAPGQPCACNQFLSEKALKAIRGLLVSATSGGGYSPKKAMRVGERSVKSIFIHQFMDPHTFDLSRARKCCQVYPQPDGRLMPACVYNCLRRPA